MRIQSASACRSTKAPSTAYNAKEPTATDLQGFEELQTATILALQSPSSYVRELLLLFVNNR